MLRTLSLLGCVFATASLCAAAGQGDKDLIVTSEGKNIYAYVYHEKVDVVEYKINEALPQMQTIRWREVARIDYKGMTEDTSLYATGMREMAGGQYAVAATRFEAVKNEGVQEGKEWKVAYGLLRQGECWELAGAFDKAAESYGEFTSSLPEHSLYTDALYRQGLALARAGKGGEAAPLVETLNTIAKERRDRGAETRANAVLTAVAGESGDVGEASQLARKVAFSPRDGDVLFHWGDYWASFLLNQQEYDQAAREYKKLLSLVQGQPAVTASLSLGYGIALAKDDQKYKALMAMMNLDALPYGSPEQRLEARYWIGRLKWETAQENIDKPDERLAEFAKGQQAEARELLKEVADAGHSEAAAFVKTLPAAAEAEPEAAAK